MQMIMVGDDDCLCVLFLIDGDGVIDLMLPACLTDDCSHSVLYACTIKLAEGGAQNNSKVNLFTNKVATSKTSR